MKQEIIEEAATKLLYNNFPFHPPRDSEYWKYMFIEGSKWMEEQMKKQMESLKDFETWKEWKSKSPKTMKTAVEWLVNELRNGKEFNDELIEQAKEMEKEQAQLYAEFAILSDRSENPIIPFNEFINIDNI